MALSRFKGGERWVLVALRAFASLGGQEVAGVCPVLHWCRVDGCPAAGHATGFVLQK